MKKEIACIALSICLSAHAQNLSPLKTFKSKESKLKAQTLRAIHDTDQLVVTAFVKKDRAEVLTFTNELNLLSNKEVPFDFDEAEKKQKEEWKSGWGANFKGGSVEILQADVLEVMSSDVLSKTSGLNLTNKGKIGLKQGGAFAIQKGDIKFITNTVGERVRTFTTFVAREELKLKSEEGKNMLYEFHSSNADQLQVEFKESDSYVSSNYKTQKSFMSDDADLLLVSKRKMIVKFGKAPSEADLLPVYYISKISPQKMDIVAQTTFNEPVSRGIIYREKLPLSNGIILVSAPLNITGEKVSKDSNPRNYMFRIIGNDTKIQQEFTYEVPSGYTQFSQVFELPNKSVVLFGAINEKKKDKYFNQGTFSVPEDGFFTLTIKDGKVIKSAVQNSEGFSKGFVLPAGEKLGKLFYNPAYELTELIANYDLPDGGLLSAWRVQYGVGGKPTYIGDIVFHFDKDGKVVNRYWLGARSEFIPVLSSALFKGNDGQYYLLTHQANDKGEIEESDITMINIQTQQMGARILVGDEKHVLNNKGPFIQKANEVQFFGFDKGGNEFWTQRLLLQ